MMPSIDFAVAPFLVIWETTQACDLACVHCRASAQPSRHPDELTTAHGIGLLAEAAAMGTPVFILSGGDPVKRPDLFDLVREGKRLGLRMGTIPAATAALTASVVRQLKEAGLDQMALSLDYPRAELHDGFRGVPGGLQQDPGGSRMGAPIRSTPPNQHDTLCRFGAVSVRDGRAG